MRVFDTYIFNIAPEIKIKDTKAHLDKMLGDLGLTYKKVGFSIGSYLTKIPVVVERNPKLKKYQYPAKQGLERPDWDWLSSLSPEWDKGNIYADREDWDDIFEIFSKIPRGLNVTGSVLFDQIDWFGDGVRETCIHPHYYRDFFLGKPQTIEGFRMFNDLIIMRRNYDDGNKFNRVEVIIEATTDGEPRDTSVIIDRLRPYLGEPEEYMRDCIESPEKSKELQKKKDDCLMKLETMLSEYVGSSYEEKFNSFETEYIKLLTEKKKLTAAFKDTGFELISNKGLLPGMNSLESFDDHMYKYTLLIDRTQSTPKGFYFYVNAQGYNFDIHSTQTYVHVESADEVTEKLADLAKFCVSIRERMGDILFENFGDTPAWYWKK